MTESLEDRVAALERARGTEALSREAATFATDAVIGLVMHYLKDMPKRRDLAPAKDALRGLAGSVARLLPALLTDPAVMADWRRERDEREAAARAGASAVAAPPQELVLPPGAAPA